MVYVENYAVRENRDGEKFYALIVSGGLEILKSSKGKQYATLRRCSVPSTLNEEACKSIIGSQLPGTIKKVDCDPYDFVTKTGETISLNHTYEYVEQDFDNDGLADILNSVE